MVAEWVDSDDRVLLTGAIYEWDGRVRPRDYNGASKDNLKRTWWCVHPEAAIEGSTLDDLPFTFRTAGQYDRDGFKKHLNGLAAQGVNAVVTGPTITEWHQALRERRFDPDLFRYFTEVNATEGGIDALFDGIDSPGAFVRYLLRFVSDRSRTAPVRDLLSETEVEIAKRPGYLAERDFCVQARPKVLELGDAHRKVSDATTTREAMRRRIAGYKKALLDKADEAAAVRRLAQERRTFLDEHFREKRSEADTARRRRDEYHRLAALFRLETAKKNVAAATARAEELALDVNGWEALGAKAVLDEAKATLSARKQALAAAAEEARPLLELIGKAQAEWAGSLEGAIDHAERRLATLDAEVEKARERKKAAEYTRRKAHERYVELSGEAQALTGQISRFQTARAQATEDGTLGSAERIEEALERCRGRLRSCAAALERLSSERIALDEALTEADRDCTTARELSTKAIGARDKLRSELTALESRAASLGDDARLRQLFQADSVDLTESAAEAITLLSGSVATVETDVLGTRLALVQDENAVDGLKADQLLPPRPAVVNVLTALHDAGITGFSGWSYLAAHIPIGERQAKIAEMPEVLEGVVVYGDPAEAAARIEAEVDDAVVMASANAFPSARAPRVVLGPAAARYDADAASAELIRRTRRLEAGRARLADLTTERDNAAGKVAAIRALVADFPEDGIFGLRIRVRTAETVAGTATADEAAALGRREDLTGRRNAIVDEHAREQAALPELRIASGRLQQLAREEQEVVNPANARLEAIPALQEVEREAGETASAVYEAADEQIEYLRDEVRGLQGSKRTWSATRATLSEEPIRTGKNLETTEAVVEELKGLLRQQFPEAELRRAETEAEAAVKAAASRWERHSGPVRSRAEELADTAAAGNNDLRQEALERARAEQHTTSRRLGAADSELREAESELRAASPRGRMRHAELKAEPADRAEALRQAVEADEQATVLQTEAGQLERERDDAGRAADDAGRRIGVLNDQADLFRAIEPADAATGVVPDSDDEVRSKVKGLAQEFEAQENEYTGLLGIRSQQAERLRSWAAEDRFAAVAEDENGQAVRRLRELFRSEQLYERVAVRADELAGDLDVRQQAITRQLLQVEEHKRNVVSRLGDLVEDALRLLGRASVLSELPEGVGPWAGFRFLSVDARQRPTPEQISLRIGDLVDRMVNSRKVEADPTELLWRATEASVSEGFRASVLKPAPDQPTGRTPVEDMRKWSGGENLTASLVLFCVMARLRTEQRTGLRSGSAGGLVPLDNPLGKANYLPFLDLQRRVARANGVQLVFLTGIGDLGAVTAFPRIAAMHKRPSATRPGRAYVSNDLDNSSTGSTQSVDVVASVRREP
ncbi:hypothetical protein FPZ12_008100 [Amycolatopsis acidicola]|uniref:Chromosome segregation ATPase n=1 Tax=Amycolatopsis acidicola TaxID=2596893 RepID=A0A5N0VH36_9PSEU|nr:hypothetical protein [Amycolatopsis acidicola]KAA9163982.1 hypothetical protein FPZ12_008100 [Amycolatopsis acidicola]